MASQRRKDVQMSCKYFGTDGIRGNATGPLMEQGFLRRLGYALGLFLQGKQAGAPIKVVIGRDTRGSGSIIGRHLEYGLAGVDAMLVRLGVIPTPAVSLMVKELEASMGIMITASHNPATDNGIKLFNANGIKYTVDDELEIEKIFDENDFLGAEKRPNMFTHDALDQYVDYVSRLMKPGALSDWIIAVDAANGASGQSTPAVLERLGAQYAVIGNQPNGENINDGIGSEHPWEMIKVLKEISAWIGIAHDGDGDRLVVADENGQVVNGDQIIGILALHQDRNKLLKHKKVVVTVQSNRGLDLALKKQAIDVIRVEVGDRNVIHEMLAQDLLLGGESSGHIIFRDVLPTGDGLVAALKLIEIMIETRRPLSDLCQDVLMLPQDSRSFDVKVKVPLQNLPDLAREIQLLEKELGDAGRILVRYSGTESKIRLLIEAQSLEICQEGMERLERAASVGLELL